LKINKNKKINTCHKKIKKFHRKSSHTESSNHIWEREKSGWFCEKFLYFLINFTYETLKKRSFSHNFRVFFDKNEAQTKSDFYLKPRTAKDS